MKTKPIGHRLAPCMQPQEQVLFESAQVRKPEGTGRAQENGNVSLENKVASFSTKLCVGLFLLHYLRPLVRCGGIGAEKYMPQKSQGFTLLIASVLLSLPPARGVGERCARGKCPPAGVSLHRRFPLQPLSPISRIADGNVRQLLGPAWTRTAPSPGSPARFGAREAELVVKSRHF
jgi:hypothetical protein